MNGAMDRGLLGYLTRTKTDKCPGSSRCSDYTKILRGKTKGTFAFYKMKY